MKIDIPLNNRYCKEQLAQIVMQELHRQYSIQQEMAEAVGVSRPRINDLITGKLEKFSLESLIKLGMSLGLIIELAVYL